MKRTLGTALLGALMLLVPAQVASGDAPTRSSTTDDLSISWSCPGPNPVEEATMTTRVVEYARHGEVSKRISHIRWRGWITHRETGDLIRDDGSWTETQVYRDGEEIRAVTTGVIWKLTIPGHGIVVHQAGRGRMLDDDWTNESTFGATPNIRGMCRYV